MCNDGGMAINWAKNASRNKGSQVTCEEFTIKVKSDRISLTRSSVKTYWTCIKATLDLDPSLPLPEMDIPTNTGASTSNIIQRKHVHNANIQWA